MQEAERAAWLRWGSDGGPEECAPSSASVVAARPRTLPKPIPSLNSLARMGPGLKIQPGSS
eukprot:6247962-Alexandrium_andersonii.AAC.1